MNKICLILYGKSSELIKELINNNITFDVIDYYSKSIIIVINISDFSYIKKHFKYKIKKYYGVKKIYYIFNRYKISIISIVFSILIITILSNIIFNIKIETNNNYLKNKIYKELNDYGIKKYHFKKNYKEINKIKAKIVDNNKNHIEWLEIVSEGTTYKVKITERKINKKKKNKEIRNIVSSKDGIIRKITYTNGVLLKDVGDYVKKGEIIITGNIIKGEDDLKGQVSSEGKVYGEVWYIVNVTIPYNYKYLNKNKEFNRYYLKFFDKEITLINYYKNNNVRKNKTKILDKVYLPFDIYKEKVIEHRYKTKKISVDEAYNIGINKAISNIRMKLDSDEYIVSKKVLKKEPFRSKISLEVFIKCYENITNTSKLNILERGSVKSDT